MRLLLPFLLVLAACAAPPPGGYVATAPVAAPLPPVSDPSGGPSPVPRPRDVVVGGVSVVGRWVAVEVVGDPSATSDLRAGDLSKVLVINPTGRATLHGWDGREGTGDPVTYVGQVDRERLRLADLPGEAVLRLAEHTLFVTDPGATVTAYAWDGR